MNGGGAGGGVEVKGGGRQYINSRHWAPLAFLGFHCFSCVFYTGSCIREPAGNLLESLTKAKEKEPKENKEHLLANMNLTEIVKF